ncbi:hypothetical protein [Cohaesibacter gelatinilyticus]|uniref:Uncharacterized protein n=1 Tax=Cohaesibacter gelatinilyticus TaxID=372072 RepID=A0A285PMJ4_9HYPH|nr:hypothetical protein [Cohaesibacter gelatinilyticus]SNZ21356.1 hypothetical protein SAMN06265368_4476 [Cohaesibacter gelatinilyticus]
MNETSDYLGFTYQIRRGEEVQIFHHGRLATTLRGDKADDFLEDIEDMSDADSQQWMARLTGNYKRGNERQAKSHPRNRR